MADNRELITPLALPGPLRPPQAPVRRTYGRKRILDPELLDMPGADMPMKKTKTIDTPLIPLVTIPVNSKPSSRMMESSPGPAPSRFPSPVKPTYRGRGVQDQNALDSPFLEPRKPSGSRPALLRRTSSTRIPASAGPKPILQSRHFSLNQSRPKPTKKRGQDEKEELRRKTSEATTTVSVAMSEEHSWLVPAPPRVLGARYMSTGETDFSFNPPAESTLVPHLYAPPARVVTPRGIEVEFGSPTPRAPVEVVRDANMRPRRKRRDSILSTDSEDSATTMSVTRLLPMVGVPHIKPKSSFRQIDMNDDDDDVTPRRVRVPPLIEQFCKNGSMSRSGSATVRPLNESFHKMELGDADAEMEAQNADKVARQDPSLGALADACASMDLHEPDPGSPLARRLRPRRQDNKRTENRLGSRRAAHPVSPLAAYRAKRSTGSYQLSPRAVRRLAQRPRVGMRIEDNSPSPNNESDMFASYEFDRGQVKAGPSNSQL